MFVQSKFHDLWIAAGLLALTAQAPPRAEAPAQVSTATRKAAAEWVAVEKVVDGDTIHVRRAGKIEKLRLLSVDTEERLGPGHAGTATKPQTVFGEECALWAQKLFADLGKDGLVEVGLVFPGGEEKRDAYGRLLCHTILRDGTNYELMLVQLGKSPYFNKYGNDLLDHEGFEAAQRLARRAKVGIWNPDTNAPATPGAPSAKRPYPELIAWWNARAIAIGNYRKRAAAAPGEVADAEDPDSLERASRSNTDFEVFGEVDRIFDEKNGDRTVLLQTSSKERALRVVVPAGGRETHAVLDLDGLAREFRQNYVWVRGRVRPGARGYTMRSESPDAWRRAGPEPALPAPARK